MGLLTDIINQEYENKRQEKLRQTGVYSAVLGMPGLKADWKQYAAEQLMNAAGLKKGGREVFSHLLKPLIHGPGMSAKSAGAQAGRKPEALDRQQPQQNSGPGTESAGQQDGSEPPQDSLFYSPEQQAQQRLAFEKQQTEQKAQVAIQQKNLELQQRIANIRNSGLPEPQQRQAIMAVYGVHNTEPKSVPNVIDPSTHQPSTMLVYGDGRREFIPQQPKLEHVAQDSAEVRDLTNYYKSKGQDDQQARASALADRAKELTTKEQGAEKRNRLIGTTGRSARSSASNAPAGPELPPAGPADAQGRHPKVLAKMSPGQSAIVKKMVDYDYPIPSAFAWRTPYWQRIMEAAAEYDPTFSAINYPVRAKLKQDFTSGKAAANIRSLNTAVAHLSTLKQAADQLHNSGNQIWNEIANKGLTVLKGDRRVTNFNVAATAVENELASAFAGKAATNPEFLAWKESLNSIESPEQLHGAVDTAVNLIAGRVNALKFQYESGMGRPPTVPFLTEKSREILNHIRGDAGTSKNGGTNPAAVNDPLGILQ